MPRAPLVLLPGLLLVSATSAAGPAGAEDPYAEVAPGKSALVGEAIARGQRARDAGRWADAKAAYGEALAGAAGASDAERAAILGELGLSELALGDYRDAAEHLAAGLRDPDVLRPALRRRVEAARRKAEAQVATLYLAVGPADAEVLVDGHPVGRPAASYEIFLEGGQHTIRARLSGHIDAVQTFDAVIGKVHTIAMDLPRAPEPLASAPPKARAGAASSSASRPARAARPSPWASWPGTVRIVGIAATTAAASAGAFLLVRSSVLHGDLLERRDGLVQHEGLGPTSCRQPSLPPGCTDLFRLRDERDLFSRLGTGALAAGAALGAVTAASFFVDLSFLGGSPAREGARLAPVATGREVGLMVGGVW